MYSVSKHLLLSVLVPHPREFSAYFWIPWVIVSAHIHTLISCSACSPFSDSFCASVSVPSYSYLFPHLVDIKVVYDSIKASVQVIEQGHYLEGRKNQEGWGVRPSPGAGTSGTDMEVTQINSPGLQLWPRPGSPAWVCSLLIAQ